jgi:hypothetical protein
LLEEKKSGDNKSHSIFSHSKASKQEAVRKVDEDMIAKADQLVGKKVSEMSKEELEAIKKRVAQRTGSYN